VLAFPQRVISATVLSTARALNKVGRFDVMDNNLKEGLRWLDQAEADAKTARDCLQDGALVVTVDRMLYLPVRFLPVLSAGRLTPAVTCPDPHSVGEFDPPPSPPNPSSLAPS